MTIACCYASGHIAFLPEVPPDMSALPLCEGPEGAVHRFMSAVARHSRDGNDLLVPGMPECGEDQDAAMDAMFKFVAWIGKNPPKGVTVYGGKPVRKKRRRS